MTSLLAGGLVLVGLAVIAEGTLPFWRFTTLHRSWRVLGALLMAAGVVAVVAGVAVLLQPPH